MSAHKEETQIDFKEGKGFRSIEASLSIRLLGLGLQHKAVETAAAFLVSAHIWEGKTQMSGHNHKYVLHNTYAPLLCLRRSHKDEGQFVTYPPTLTQNKVIKPDLLADSLQIFSPQLTNLFGKQGPSPCPST